MTEKEIDQRLQEAIDDIVEGRTSGPFESVRELISALK